MQRLGELCRKLWNPHNFKAHVSPHEMLQAAASVSKKRFKITEQGSNTAAIYMYVIDKLQATKATGYTVIELEAEA